MATTEMTVGDVRTAESSLAAQWSDLPDDLLGLVRYMVPSLRDRVRIAAVCKPWRGAASRLPAPPAVPLLLLAPRTDGKTKHLCGPDESWVLRVPDKVVEMCFAGSHSDGWIAAFHNFRLLMVNLFSGSEVVAPTLMPNSLYQNPITKIIFSQAPTSNKRMLATITNNHHDVALCNLGRRSAGWTTQGWNKKIFTDIAFCGGDLYGLMHRTQEVIKFTIGVGAPVITSAHLLPIQTRDGPSLLTYDSTYILELHGKLLMAVMTRWLPDRADDFIKVFMLVDTDIGEPYEHRWEEVSDFGDYALFLGPMSSMAVHVPAGAEHRGLERNRIYYSNPTYSRETKLPGDEVYSVMSNDGVHMYCREEPDIGDGVNRTRYNILGWDDLTMWVFPPEF
ncbi:hypothetical protein ACQ4PT_039191 [Festuca glaucescens]